MLRIKVSLTKQKLSCVCDLQQGSNWMVNCASLEVIYTVHRKVENSLNARTVAIPIIQLLIF